MNRLIKILFILFGLFLLIGGLLTRVLGDRTKNETEYIFEIDNKTLDTLYVERPIDDFPWDKIVYINGAKYLMVLPNDYQIYHIDHHEYDEDNEDYKWPLKDTLILIKKSDTLNFIFNDKQKIKIETDSSGRNTITRTID